ncbi:MULTISPECIES: toprim domain-containing protein [unclassified Mesorhizobium]|uniref:DUF7146 domain-containing protein n=1 Tax=unclassified Mesorhizobium TaxID=325217 RepID=UPI000FCA3191|nr:MULTISPECIES: toprim domain-containing protein [unclassified Mesorhizobium]RVD54535.1 virulence-associated protein E [Mesorhizobium sp. M2D.F.Ca.ET.140.01.1.1]TGP69388.1 virulence-associated protein E [Mesorhizobium sp. M2D.F.Ca.ET.224.01.1.1]TGP86608.1 virulence-associated protein E [bacterium M00.F.Ca.ET.222.01.1.1]
MTDIRTLAHALGGDVAGRNRVTCPGPGHSTHDRSLSVTFEGESFMVHSFAGDDWQRCKDYVRERLGYPKWEPGDGQDRRIPKDHLPAFDARSVDSDADDLHRTEDDLIRIRRARDLWDEGFDPRHTLVETYLHSRCLDLGDDLAGNILRFHPRCPWRDENTGKTVLLPALIAAFRSIDDDQVTAVHRIALRPDGGKVGRRMLGVVHRAAVKLDPIGTDLAIGEGIETAMAARQLGYSPAWALGSVGAISFFPVISGVKRLLILGEIGKASEQAVRICGQRWQKAWRRVAVVQPAIGSDLNDELMSRVRRHG